MRIVPFVSFGPHRLGLAEQEVLQHHGIPVRRVVTKEGLIELDYGDCVVRLETNRGTVEITARPELVELENRSMSRFDLPSCLQELDSESLESLGFMVSRRLGVAVDMDVANDGWISVFVEGYWDSISQ
jgi:hypothetical protein